MIVNTGQDVTQAWGRVNASILFDAVPAIVYGVTYMTDTADIRFVRSVDRAIDVLEQIARNGRPMSLSEIFRAVNTPKSTTLNIVRTLAHRRILELDPETKKYRAGPILLTLARDVSSGIELPKMAKPHLERLAAATRETALLGVIDQDELVYVEGVDSSEPIRFVAQIGLRRPLHCASGGKLGLALRDEAEWESYIDRSGLKKFTEKTITDPEAFRAELRKTRERGYGASESETVADVIGIAAPVFQGPGGKFLGVLAIPGPAFRMRRNFKSILKELRAAANALTIEMLERSEQE